MCCGLRIAEGLGDRAMEASLLARLAIVASNRLRFTDAVAYGERAVATARAAGDDQALALELDGLKTAYAYLGEIAKLVDVVEELEPLQRSSGDLFRLQWTVFESAFPFLAAGDWELARLRISEALELNRRSGYAERITAERVGGSQAGWGA